uniref:Uncharacterized protein n=1 Tax=Lactuca sativa TaxID=4236 RepID=A0A9R1WTV2_LACSA|nr:hypothetical protein LSAT_V11C900470810 [Lactuca sativa]
MGLLDVIPCFPPLSRVPEPIQIRLVATAPVIQSDNLSSHGFLIPPSNVTFVICFPILPPPPLTSFMHSLSGRLWRIVSVWCPNQMVSWFLVIDAGDFNNLLAVLLDVSTRGPVKGSLLFSSQQSFFDGFKVLASTYLHFKEEEKMELFGAIEGLLKNVSLGAIIERFEPRRQTGQETDFILVSCTPLEVTAIA